MELEQTVYALDSTTIDLCLSLFPWAPVSPTQGAVKLHTLIDLRGNIPVFCAYFPRENARCHGPRSPAASNRVRST